MPPIARSPSSRPLRRLVVIGVVAIVLVCIVGVVAVIRLRSHEMGQAERNLKAMDLILGEETERAIQSADLILRSFQEKIAADKVETVADLQRTQSLHDTFVLLESRVAGVPQIAAVSLLGPTGMVIASSRAFPAPALDVSSRSFFQLLKAGKPDQRILSEPLENRVDGRWTSYLARRINSSDGQFLGVISAAIRLDYFEDLYKSLDVGKGGAVSLWRNDGLLMARFPPLEGGVGKRFAIKSFSGILRPDQPVTYEVAASIDGLGRLVASIGAKQFPLVINVTETFDQILQDWRQTAAIIVVGCLVFVVSVVAVMWLLALQFRAYEALDVAQNERGEAVAARDHAEDQLRQAQKLDAIGQLTGGVAHDFNNLLTAVLGNLELLQRHGRDLDERFQRWAQNALDAAERGAILTQRLLAFSRRQPLEPTATDVARRVASMSDLLERTLGENVRLETHLGADLSHADVDPNQLDNAILNIAINGRDAMAGHGTLTIEARNVTLDRDFRQRNPDLTRATYVLIAITDTGAGIPQAVLDRVFEPFFSTKPIGQGTGLGLSQVYGFVKQTGGHIEIESTIGVGTRVAIYLPCAERESAEVSGATVVEDPTFRAGLRVLVVEDDESVLAYSLETMRELGFHPVAAGDATQALARMRSGQRFDLLFTDVGLPGLNGHELAVQALQLQPDLKVLFASGYTRDVIMHQGRLDKGIQLLAKPFTRAQLQAKLGQILVVEPSRQRAAG